MTIKAIATTHGWSFDAISANNYRSTYQNFDYFSKGHSQECENTVEGAIEIHGFPHHLKMGDYLYKETDSDEDGTSTTTYRFSYLCLHLPYLHVPDLFIRRETMTDKLGAAVGFDDINFESADFSRTFHVSASDKRFAYDVITPTMMEFLLRAPDVGVELRSGILCFVSDMRRWKAEEFMPRVNWASHFIGLWPEHVIQSYTGTRI